jgi:hypothetical protein
MRAHLLRRGTSAGIEGLQMDQAQDLTFERTNPQICSTVYGVPVRAPASLLKTYMSAVKISTPHRTARKLRKR